MFKHLIALAAVAAVSLPAQAVIVTQWNFNSVSADAAPATGTTAASIGAGIASLVGGTTATFASGDANGGSSDPATGDDSGWNATTYAAQGTGDKSRGVRFAVSTVGVSNVVVVWDQRLSNTTSRFTQFQYTTDGATFSDAAGGLFSGSPGDTWFKGRTVDLSAVAGVANNASFGFRMVSTFAPSTATYLSATAGTAAAYSAAGTNRFDMVTVNAAPIPEPETYALMLAGLAALGFLLQRRA